LYVISLSYYDRAQFLTTIPACLILLYISYHTHWKSTVHAEVQAILHKRLSSLPIAVWEDEMPTIDLVLRETIRLVVNGTALRRNLPDGSGGNLKMSGGEVEVPSGGFMAYSLTDAHMNPGGFDPERFSPGREGEAYLFLGWGAGE
jgi:sterol 14-demethylase